MLKLLVHGALWGAAFLTVVLEDFEASQDRLVMPAQEMREVEKWLWNYNT